MFPKPPVLTSEKGGTRMGGMAGPSAGLLGVDTERGDATSLPEAGHRCALSERVRDCMPSLGLWRGGVL